MMIKGKRTAHTTTKQEGGCPPMEAVPLRRGRHSMHHDRANVLLSQWGQCPLAVAGLEFLHYIGLVISCHGGASILLL